MQTGYDESAATPEQMYEYLLNKFAIDTETYDRYRAYQIVVIRYALYLSSYQKYIAIGIAEDVSDQTVAMIREHASELQGVEVREDTKRVYDYPEYFSHILGYTGKISDSEYDDLSAQDDPTARVISLVKRESNRLWSYSFRERKVPRPFMSTILVKYYR